MGLHELVDRRFQLRRILAEGDAGGTSIDEGQVLVDVQLLEYPCPEAGDEAIGKRQVDEARVDHLENIGGLEVLVGRLNRHQWSALCAEFRIQLIDNADKDA